MAFHYFDGDMMKKIITTLIRPRLEYAAVVWPSRKKKDIRKLERIQRIATKMVPELLNLSYETRLGELGLPTLKERRERGDLMALYRNTSGMDVLDRNYSIEMEGRRRLTPGFLTYLFPLPTRKQGFVDQTVLSVTRSVFDAVREAASRNEIN